MDKKKINIGVDIGGTTISTGFIDETGKLILHNKLNTKPERGSDLIFRDIIKNIKESLALLKITVSDVNSIGVGVPGTADSKNGVVVFAPNLFWKDVILSDVIREAFKVPVFLGQDSRGCCMG